MAIPSVERRLAAILSADVVGYSRLMGEDEEGTLRTLHACREIIDRLIGEHHGRVFGGAGDSVIAEFTSAVEAVLCAADMQAAIETSNAALPEERRMRFRIGVNLGDVMVDRGNLQGDGVNVAVRLEALADPGSICISGAVFEQVKGKLPFGYEALGEQRLKNITEPVRVYRVRTEPEAAGTLLAKEPPKPSYVRWGSAAAIALIVLTAVGTAGWRFYVRPLLQERQFAEQVALPLPDKPSIAVLPFASLSTGPDQAYFSDGITDDLITHLSQLSGLFVIARNTAFTYKNQPVNVREVGRELGVRYVIEGSVQRAGDRLRINAQLIDAATGFHLWAERFDRELGDVFALQDEVSKRIASALEVQLTQSEREGLAHRPTDSLEAYDAFLRGREVYWRYSEQSHLQARSYFERAIEFDPNFARAYANLARTYTGTSGGFSEMSIDRAYQLAQEAIALDDSIPDIHWVMGIVRLYRKDHAGAIASMERALALNPNYADSYAQLAWVLNYAGQPKEALRLMEKAMRLNPRYTFNYSMVLGETNFTLGRYHDAISALEEGLQRNPTAQRLRIFLAASYAQAGRFEDAAWETAELLTLDPDFSLEDVAEVAPYKDPEPLERLIDGARKAGLT